MVYKWSLCTNRHCWCTLSPRGRTLLMYIISQGKYCWCTLSPRGRILLMYFISPRENIVDVIISTRENIVDVHYLPEGEHCWCTLSPRWRTLLMYIISPRENIVDVHYLPRENIHVMSQCLTCHSGVYGSLTVVGKKTSYWCITVRQWVIPIVVWTVGVWCLLHRYCVCCNLLHIYCIIQ